MGKMKERPKKMFISYLLDETASMAGCWEQTISGFNEYIESLRNNEKAKGAKFTLTKFNSSKVEIVHDAVAMTDVIPLSKDNYCPDNCTPLYDAIGRTIRALERQTDGIVDPSVLVVIQTDGQENDSKEFNQKQIFDLIKSNKKDGWTFVFMGADQDAWVASQVFGISKGNTLSYASSDTHQTYRGLSCCTINFLDAGGGKSESFFGEEDDA